MIGEETKSRVKKEIKENRYVQALFRYGIIPLTLLLEEYEQHENFEECEIIVSAIKYVNKYTEPHVDDKLPTRYSSGLVQQIKSEFNKYGMKGNIAMQNTPYYIEEIKKMVKL